MSTLCMQSMSTGVTKQIGSRTDTLSCRVLIHFGDIKLISSSTHLTICIRKVEHLNTSGVSTHEFTKAMKGTWKDSSISTSLAKTTGLPQLVVAKASLPRQNSSSGFVAHPVLLHAIVTTQYVCMGYSHRNTTIDATCAAICVEPNNDPQESTHIMSITKQQELSKLKKKFKGNPCIDARGYTLIKISQLGCRHRQERRPSTSFASPTLCLSYNAQPLALAEPSKPIAPVKWLLLSQDNLNVASICACLDMRLAATVVSMSTTCTACAYGVHVGNEEDLLQVLCASEADKCLLVHDTFNAKVGHCNREEHALATLAMLWAYRAFARAQPHYKLCTISITDGMSVAQPLSNFPQGMSYTHDVIILVLLSAVRYSLKHAQKVNPVPMLNTGVAKTLFMEDRQHSGVIVMLNRRHLPPMTLLRQAVDSLEYAISIEGNRTCGLRMQRALPTLPRACQIDAPYTQFVIGGTKVWHIDE